MKVRAVVALKAEYRLDVLLNVAGLPRSTFFYHQARLQAPDPRAELKASITDAFTASHGRYGYHRVHRLLAGEGWQVAKKTVLNLMRQLVLICRSRRERRYVSFQGEVGADR